MTRGIRVCSRGVWRTRITSMAYSYYSYGVLVLLLWCTRITRRIVRTRVRVFARSPKWFRFEDFNFGVRISILILIWIGIWS